MIGLNTPCEACGKNTSYVIVVNGKAHMVCKGYTSCMNKVKEDNKLSYAQKMKQWINDVC